MTKPPSLQAATAKVQRLPPLPASSRQLLAYLNEEHVQRKDLVRAIACDQALALNVLRIANSPFFGMANRIHSIEDAVVVVGFSSLRMIAVVAMTASLRFPNLEHDPEVRVLFHHSLAVAITASVLGRSNALDASTLFLAGVLHDIGRLALMSTYPQLYREVRQLALQNNLYSCEAEKQVFGFDHADIGASLCRHWNLPEGIVLAIAAHHAISENAVPPQDWTETDQLAGVIQLADAMAHGLNLEENPHPRVPPVPQALWSRLIGRQLDLAATHAEIRQLYRELAVLIAV